MCAYLKANAGRVATPPSPPPLPSPPASLSPPSPPPVAERVVPTVCYPPHSLECASSLVKMLEARVAEGDSRGLPPPSQHSCTLYDTTRPPGVSLFDYLRRWIISGLLDSTKIVIAALLIERFVKCKDIPLTSFNVHRILVAAIVTSAKVHEDHIYSNTHYSNVGGITKGELARIEMTFLVDLDWCTFISPEEFSAAHALLSGGCVPAGVCTTAQAPASPVPPCRVAPPRSPVSSVTTACSNGLTASSVGGSTYSSPQRRAVSPPGYNPTTTLRRVCVQMQPPRTGFHSYA